VSALIPGAGPAKAELAPKKANPVAASSEMRAKTQELPERSRIEQTSELRV